MKVKRINKAWVVTNLCDAIDIVKGIAKDNNGSIYYTTYDNNIWRLENFTKNPDHLIRSCVLSTPQEYTFGRLLWNNGTLYVTDSCTDSIFSFCLDTKELKNVFATDCQLHGLAMDNNGDLYCSNSDSITKIDMKKNCSNVIFASTTQNSFSIYDIAYPDSLVCVEDSVFVLDDVVSCVAYLKDRIEHHVVSGELFHDICYDHCGNVLVSDSEFVSEICNENGKLTSYVCADYDGTLFLTCNKSLFKLECIWKWERFLWIGHLKENSSYCPLASIPKDIVAAIAGQLRRFATLASVLTVELNSREKSE